MNTGELNTLMLNGSASGSGDEIHVFGVPYGDMIVTAPQGSLLNILPQADIISQVSPSGHSRQ